MTDRASASLAPSRSSPSGSPEKPAPQGKSASSDPKTPTRVIAIANQKGGVGKSTTAVSLGAALADNGHRVLVIDLDPQGNASTGMGIRHEAREVTVYDVLAADAPLEAAVVETAVAGLSAIPSTIDLAGAEIELVSQFSREAKLKKAIEPVRAKHVYDFIILDCPPSLGLLTVNALTAAEELIVPIQCEYYALEGLGQLLRNVGLVQQNINPDLRLSGIVMTMFDPRTKLSEQVVQEVQRYFGDLVYDVIIPRTVRLSEAPGFGQPITVYDPKSKGAESYRRLATEVAARPPPSGPVPSFEDLPTVVVTPPDQRPSPEGAPEEDLPDEDPAPRSATEPEPPPRVVDEPAPVAAPAPAPAPAPVKSSAERAAPRRRKPRAQVEAELNEDLWEPPAPGSAAAPSSPDGRRTPRVAEPHQPPAAPREHPAPRPVEPGPAPGPAPSAGRGPAPRVVVIDEDAADYLPTGERRPGADASSVAAPPPSIGATLEEEDTKPRRWRLFRKGGE